MRRVPVDSLRRLIVRGLSRPLEARGDTARADAIVVLGAPLRPDGSLSFVAEERVRAGVALWRQGVAPRLVLTGGHGPRAAADLPAEAEAMARRARELGVPDEALALETESTNTSENASFSAALLGPGRRVVVVTQPFHLRRAVLWFRRVGLRATGHHIADSLQYESRSGLRWVLKEYGSLARDLLVTRRPGRAGP